MEKEIRTVIWKDGAVVMIDQKALPVEERYVTCTDYREVIAAINDLTIRGAPAIGVAAAMGIALGALHIAADAPESFRNAFDEICLQFSATRPTARNLFWAIERMKRRCDDALPTASAATVHGGSVRTPSEASGRVFQPQERRPLTDGPVPPYSTGNREAFIDFRQPVREALVAEAVRIGAEDVAINRRIGENGRELIPDGARILTHCNAGALATAGYGTALGVIRSAWEDGKKLHVFVDETRPVLQGARLTAWELVREGIPCTLIADNMAGFLMRQGKVDLVIVGADRIARNGEPAHQNGAHNPARLGDEGFPNRLPEVDERLSVPR